MSCCQGYSLGAISIEMQEDSYKMILVDPAISALCSHDSIIAMVCENHGRKCGITRESLLLNRDLLDDSLYADR